MLIRECAWCQAILGVTPSPEGGTTHGICPSCQTALFQPRGLMVAAIMKKGEAATRDGIHIDRGTA